MNIEPWFHLDGMKLQNTWKLLNIFDNYELWSISTNIIIIRNTTTDWYVLLIAKTLSYHDAINTISYDSNTIFFDGIILDVNTPHIDNLIIMCKSIWELASIVTQIDNMEYKLVVDDGN